MTGKKLGLLFLHALPLDGSMWAAQLDILPGLTYAPTLYGLGNNVEEWAEAALRQVAEEHFVVVGCSIGGSCALELAAIAPGRVAAMVLIATKAKHRPDPELRELALQTVRTRGLEEAWQTFWAPLFAKGIAEQVVGDAKRIALCQSPEDVACGVSAFHSRPSRDEVLGSFPGPVVVICGDEDKAPGLEVSRAQAELARQGHLHIIPNCGHYVPLEQPERLNSILCDVIAAQT